MKRIWGLHPGSARLPRNTEWIR